MNETFTFGKCRPVPVGYAPGGAAMIGPWLLFCFCAASLFAGQNSLSLIRGPYLQSGTTTNITVCWRTDQASDSQVQFGLNSAANTWTASDASLTTEHRVLLPDLAPNTKYFYRIGAAGVSIA